MKLVIQLSWVASMVLPSLFGAGEGIVPAEGRSRKAREEPVRPETGESREFWRLPMMENDNDCHYLLDLLL
jgi:hypothetical protein